MPLIAKKDKVVCAGARRYLKSHRDKQFRAVVTRKMKQLEPLLIQLGKQKLFLKTILRHKHMIPSFASNKGKLLKNALMESTPPHLNLQTKLIEKNLTYITDRRSRLLKFYLLIASKKYMSVHQNQKYFRTLHESIYFSYFC